MGEMVNVMLVEDHSLFRQALAVLLDDEPGLRVVAQVGSLAEARERASALKTPSVPSYWISPYRTEMRHG